MKKVPTLRRDKRLAFSWILSVNPNPIETPTVLNDCKGSRLSDYFVRGRQHARQDPSILDLDIFDFELSIVEFIG
jgi:hypothetical protein